MDEIENITTQRLRSEALAAIRRNSELYPHNQGYLDCVKLLGHIEALKAEIASKDEQLRSVRNRLDAVRCDGTLGSRPWWMGVDQYDPCRCNLPRGHEGEHACEHTEAASV